MAAVSSKQTIERFVEEAFNKGNLDIADEMYAERYLAHAPAVPQAERTPDDVKQFVGMYRAAFPDGQSTVEDVIEEGDKLVYRWSYRGTHEGPLMGIEPTGKQVSITGITIVRLADGKIVEEWNSWDLFGLMQQLGVAPSFGEA